MKRGKRKQKEQPPFSGFYTNVAYRKGETVMERNIKDEIDHEGQGQNFFFLFFKKEKIETSHNYQKWKRET